MRIKPQMVALALAWAGVSLAQTPATSGWRYAVSVQTSLGGSQVLPVVVRYFIGPHQVRTEVSGFGPAFVQMVTIVNAADSSIRILDARHRSAVIARYHPPIPQARAALADAVRSASPLDDPPTMSILGHPVQRYQLALKDSSAVTLPIPMACGGRFSGVAAVWQTVDVGATAALDTVATALRSILGAAAPQPWLASADPRIEGVPLRVQLTAAGQAPAGMMSAAVMASVIDLAHWSVNESLFVVPAGYQTVDLTNDPRAAAELAMAESQLTSLCPPSTVVARAAASGDGPFFQFQVEKPVSIRPGSGSPYFPVELRAVNITGEVLAQFVVDSTGYADMATFKALRSTDPAFTESVRAWVTSAQFIPAEVGGRKVKQLVQMPFQFHIAPPF